MKVISAFFVVQDLFFTLKIFSHSRQSLSVIESIREAHQRPDKDCVSFSDPYSGTDESQELLDDQGPVE